MVDLARTFPDPARDRNRLPRINLGPWYVSLPHPAAARFELATNAQPQFEFTVLLFEIQCSALSVRRLLFYSANGAGL